MLNYSPPPVKKSGKKKPGFCPKTTGGLCILGCNDDDDCVGAEKCCSNGCGRTCQIPTAEKPGFCRVFPPDTMGICALLCFSDADCPGAKKCCSVGCGLTCQTPTAGEVQHSAGALQSESCLPLHGAVLITRHKGSLLPSLSAGRN
uniref:WAP domain-containing protein n=1 Tax=Chelonoidis abingdonii TaxID=106734 RepID=A0A8C0GMM9_CHEAB